MWGVLPFQASAQPTTLPVPDTERAVAQAQGSGQPVEVTSLRDESSETYATPDGGFEVDQHLRPVRARVAGAWKPIDDTLVEQPDGSVAPAAAGRWG